MSKGGKIVCGLQILFAAAGFFILPKTVLANSNTLIITEMMYDPQGTDAGQSDWLEMYNAGTEKISISQNDFGIIDEKELDLGADGIHYKNCHRVNRDIEIKPREFYIIASNEDYFKKEYPALPVNVSDSAFSLSSNGDSVRISADGCKSFFAEFDFENSWGGKNNGRTLEKITYSNNYLKSSWQESYVSGGTPGKEKSTKPVPRKYSSHIRINEIFPNPKTGEKEFIELYNPEKDILDGLVLKDKSGKKCELPKEIPDSEFTVLSDCGIKLNDTQGETLALYTADNEMLSRLEYKGSAKENVSYNFDGSVWRWSKKLTPGKENQFNNLPTKKLKIEKNIYKNMLAEFRVEASDADNDALKFTWNFGDGHKSYLKETKHKYEKKGTYTVSLRIFDGSEEIIETFEIVVGNFPKTELKITGVKVNPKGKDTEKEIIKIKNNSKKKIDLKGWSVATGQKELYNHPINKKFVIKPGETKELTRKYSAFALNNKQAKIELRRPDGSVASKVKYSKKDGIEDDEIYEKTENGWEWMLPEGAESLEKEGKEVVSETSEAAQSPDSVNTEETTNQENLVPTETEEEGSFAVENQVLGAETIRITPNNSGKESSAGNIFWRIVRNANRRVNAVINFFF